RRYGMVEGLEHGKQAKGEIGGYEINYVWNWTFLSSYWSRGLLQRWDPYCSKIVVVVRVPQ
ncbi:hypothetical protein HAX54_023513, partial [Datura stramonium]|nr:hypothetical protein [Datura stramonium]